MADVKSLSSEKKLAMSLDELIAQANANKGPQRRNNASNAQQPQQGRRNGQGNAQRQGPYSRPYGTHFRDAVGRDYLLEGEGTRQGFTNYVPHIYTVRVKNLPLDVPERELETLLRRHFGVCGSIARIIFRQKNPGEAFVGFVESSSCSKALVELQGSKMKGRVLTIEKGQPTAHAAGGRGEPAVRRGSQATRMGGAGAAAAVAPFAVSPYGGYVAVNVQPEYVRSAAGVPSGLLGHCPPTLAYVPSRAAREAAYNGNADFYDPRAAAVSVVNPGVAGVAPYGGGGAHGASLVSKQPPAQAGTTVIVSNVPRDLTSQELQDAFSVVGAVVRAELLLNTAGNTTGRVALTFESRQAALEAVRRFDGGDLNAHTIRVFLE